MRANDAFKGESKVFWAHVRALSESLGYTVRGKGTVRTFTLDDIVGTLKKTGQAIDHIIDDKGNATEFAKKLIAYSEHRANELNNKVQHYLLDAKQAEALFNELKAKYGAKDADMPWNKQKGEKKKIAYLTGMVNMVVRANAAGYPCDFDPRGLTAVTKDNMPLRTLARRVDGAFPSKIDPIAIWEIKEYYYTTTFGSRVADGVYETLLDGLELEELLEHEGVKVRHYLFVDAKYTWWDCGRSYLCRMIDMLHMGYVDAVIFGKELVDELPGLIAECVAEAKERGINPAAVVQAELGLEEGEAEEAIEAEEV